MANPQFDARRRLIHVLTMEGIPRAMLSALLDLVDRYAGAIGIHLSADPAPGGGTLILASVAIDADTVDAVSRAAAVLGGMSFCNVSITAHDAPAQVAALAEPGGMLLLHHSASGAAHAVAACAPPGVRIINIRDGLHAQPLAALADVAALRRRLPDLHTLRVTLEGDLRRDARMRGVIHMLTTLGTPELRVVHTDGIVPNGAVQLGVHACAIGERDLAMSGADVVLTYRLPTKDRHGGLVMHGAPSTQALGPPVAEPMSAVTALACALAAAIDMVGAS